MPEAERATFLEMILQIKKQLNPVFNILEFKGMDDMLTDKPLTPQDIYNHDIKDCVMKADCMLAICDFPSTGLGYEMATAVEKQNISVLAMAHQNRVVGRIIRGITHPGFRFETYSSVNDIVDKAKEILTK